MPNLKETVEILFLATDKTGNTIEGLGKGLEDLSAPIADVTKKFLLLEGAVLAIGAAFAGKAFNESVKFESALLDLQKVLAENEGNASDFTEQVDRLSLKFGESATEILNGASNIKQAGFSVVDAFKLQEDALTASVISELEVVEATDLLIRSLKGYKAEASDASRILDLFNEVSNKNATNVRQLAIGFSELSPIAGKLGLSFEETNALLTPIIETFGSGAEAGNALKIALTSLIVPTGPAKDELKRLGVAVETSGGQLRKGRDIVFEVIEALSKLDSTQQVATLSILAGERQAARLSESLGNLAGVNKVLSDQTTAAGSAQKEFNVRIAATEKQIDKAGEAFNILTRNIGDRFKPELAGAIVGIREIEQAFSELVVSGGLDPFIEAITPQLVKLEGVLKGIALALPEAWEDVDFSPIVRALEEIFEGASTLFDGLDLSKPEDLAIAINNLIDVGASFIQTTEGIFSVLGTVGGVIIDVIQFYGDLDDGTQQLVGTVGGAALALNTFAPAIASVGAAVSALAGVGGPLKLLLGALTGPVGIAIALGTSALAFGAFVAEAEAAENKLSKLPKEIETASFAFKRLGFETIESFKESLRAGDVFFDQVAGKYEIAGGAILGVNENIEESIGGLGETFSDTGEEIESSADSVAESLERNTKLAEALGEEWRVVGGEVVKVGSDYSEALGSAGEVTKELFLTLEDGTRITGEAAKGFIALNKETDKRISKDKEAEKALTKRVEALTKFKLGIEEIQSKERVSLFELKTKVDLAQIEAATEKFKALTDTIQIGIESTGNSIVNLFKVLSEGTAPGVSLDIRNAINREIDLRERQVILQEELTRAQIDILDARREALDRGEAIINVTAEGLEPHLQEILRAIIEAAQVEATAQAQEFLLNI